MVEKIFLIVLCHAVGDYLFQTDFLAKTKGINWYHLFLHCMMYAGPFYLVFGWCWQLALVTIAHFPIDAMKARWGKITYWQDQVIHYLLAMSFLI